MREITKDFIDRQNGKPNYDIEVTQKCGLYDIEVIVRYKTRRENNGMFSIGVSLKSAEINVSATGPLAADDAGLMEGFVKAINIAKDLAIGNVQLID